MKFLSIPGPAPWYLKDIEFDLFYWGKTNFPKYLFKPPQVKILGVETYTYVKKLNETRIVAWRDSIKTKSLEFLVLEIAKLEEIGPLSISFAGCEFNSTAFEKINLEKNFTDSEYRITPKDLESMCVLADNVEAYSPSKIERVIYDIDFRVGLVKVIPIQWFNKGEFDFGYQWISRIKKESDDKYYGDGSRIAPFYMNNKGQRI